MPRRTGESRCEGGPELSGSLSQRNLLASTGSCHPVMSGGPEGADHQGDSGMRRPEGPGRAGLRAGRPSSSCGPRTTTPPCAPRQTPAASAGQHRHPASPRRRSSSAQRTCCGLARKRGVTDMARRPGRACYGAGPAELSGRLRRFPGAHTAPTLGQPGRRHPVPHRRSQTGVQGIDVGHGWHPRSSPIRVQAIRA